MVSKGAFCPAKNNPFSTGIDFTCQNLTSKVPSRTERIKKMYNSRIPMDIQMKRKELTKTFMIIYKLLKPFGLHGLHAYMSAL